YHVTRVVQCAQASLYQFVQPELLRPRNFQGAVEWSTRGCSSNPTRYVVGRDWLDQYGGKTYRVSLRRCHRECLEELKELRGLHDRVRNRRLPDELFLGDLPTEVPALTESVGAHY